MSATEDGPLFRATMKALEQKTGNMRQRMMEIGGEFQIKTTPGAGTRVSLNGSWLARQ